MMLAIRRIVSDKEGRGHLFDEIDAGLGGQTAFQVGRKLKSVATIIKSSVYPSSSGGICGSSFAGGKKRSAAARS